MIPTGTAAGRYSELQTTRSPFLERARECAKLTIPSLVPPDGHTGSSKLYKPYQGIGARGVNNLASKLLLALLPPNSPFFRLTIDDFTLDRMSDQKGMRAEVEKALSKIERAVMNEVEAMALRVPIFEAAKQLIVAGNVLLYVPTKGPARVFRLDRFVVKRDVAGNVLEIVVKEDVAPGSLPERARALVKKEAGKEQNTDASVSLYTHVVREEGRWSVYQEVAGHRVPGTGGTYPLDKCPWRPLRMIAVDGEDYGRAYVEEYIGDLISLEGLMKSVVEGAAAAAKVLFLVKPNGTTRAKTLAEAPNGAIREGDSNDVSVLQVDKFADFRVARDTITDITNRLSFAFLLNSAIQRNGERVTAEEVRYMAGELEDALGGIYSLLSQDLQLPLVELLMWRMQRTNRLPSLPKGTVRPTIVTGVEALGRGHDLNKLDTFLAGARDTLGPEVVAQYVDISDYLTRRAAALGIDTEGLIRSQEEVAQAAQQQQQMALMERVAPNAVNAFGQAAVENMKQQGTADE
ncbi:MAG: portal protein [Ferrovibrio sp.]|uniref:portal protein n=1 Tax=Ferrovibrio sp. TaxID=1917215 RepID=UPI00391ACEFA